MTKTSITAKKILSVIFAAVILLSCFIAELPLLVSRAAPTDYYEETTTGYYEETTTGYYEETTTGYYEGTTGYYEETTTGGYEGGTTYPENDGIYVEEIFYTPVTPYSFEYKTDASSSGIFTVDTREGDILTVTYSDGTVKDFVARREDYRYDFEASDGSVIPDYEVYYITDQYSENWTEGEHYIRIRYSGCSCYVSAIVTPCTIKNISAEFIYPLYLGYNCFEDSFFTSEIMMDGPRSSVISDENIKCTIEYTDGRTVCVMYDKLYEVISGRSNWYIRINGIGKNEGIISVAAFKGIFTANVIDCNEVIDTLPEQVIHAETIYLAENEEIDIQLIEFADKGYSRKLFFSAPDGLTLDENGRLTGKLTSMKDDDYQGSLYVTIVREGFYTEPCFSVTFERHAPETEPIPADVPEIEIGKTVDIEASEENPQWFTFTAPSTSVFIRKGDYTVYDANGRIIPAEGEGGSFADGFSGGFNYELIRGATYYVKLTESGKFRIVSPWMPQWKDKNDIESDHTISKPQTNVKKSFEGDTNEYWNLYIIEDRYETDFGQGFGNWAHATMQRIISPVNIHVGETEISTQQKITGKTLYKFDPNNEEECLYIGAETTQNTLKDQLSDGEKEYRFDMVYFMVPQTGKYTMDETRYLYIPVGYVLDGNRVVKHGADEHTDSEFDGRCDLCGELTGKKPVVSGDIDGDELITSSDARFALRASVGLEKYLPGTPEFKAADADKDGEITSSDARLILRASVGLESL